MRSTQEALVEEGHHSLGPGRPMDRDELDLLHLSVSPVAAAAAAAASSNGRNKTPEPVILRPRPRASAPSSQGGSPRTESEIIVRVEGMDYEMDSPASASGSEDNREEHPEEHMEHPQLVPDNEHPVNPALLGFQEALLKSFTSSASVLSDQSELTSLPSSPSSKATTPVVCGDEAKEPATSRPTGPAPPAQKIDENPTQPEPELTRPVCEPEPEPMLLDTEPAHPESKHKPESEPELDPETEPEPKSGSEPEPEPELESAECEPRPEPTQTDLEPIKPDPEPMQVEPEQPEPEQMQLESELLQPDPKPIQTDTDLIHTTTEPSKTDLEQRQADLEAKRNEVKSKPEPAPAQTKVTPTPSEPLTTPPRTTTPKKKSRKTFDVRPKVSIPTDVAPHEYAHQCIAAAEGSRLNPYALHQEEYQILREHISHAQVTTYLNIRNGILRLWLNNPRIGVAREEAIGCAKDSRWFDAANVCYDWLLRRGYINYGCADVPSSLKRTKKPLQRRKGKTVVVIGAGMAGLGCARQMEALSKQYAAQFQELGEEPPKVIVLEGRGRLGGRVYSRAIDVDQCQRQPGFQGQRHSVECGGMIITGFERGNPLNVLVRGQMALPYYALRPEATLYDWNGKPVDPERDLLVEKLYNDCLENVSQYKFKNPPSKLIEGNKVLMDEGRDSSSENHKAIALVEEANAALPQAPSVAQQSLAPQVNLVPVSTDRATGKTHAEPGAPAALKAAYKAKSMGWTLREGVPDDRDLDLVAASKDDDTTLGSLMDEAISQYKHVIELTPQDFRLMNWHVANLEYSNANNYNQLSLTGWDIDAGNEWEGKHTMVVGGYQSVPWGLAQSPSRLDIRKQSAVQKITYDPENKRAAKVECENGLTVDADYVVSTIPLGVLKHGNVEFNPPLPSWKTDAIDRLGFGVLNKVILVYREAFWDTSRDIFGVLRSPQGRQSLRQSDYASRRGRFFQWFNVSNTSGLPVLLALMAGDAAYDTEYSKNDDLVKEATNVLRSLFGTTKVPEPASAVVTRWGSDRFARGAYSSAGPSMKPDDYDTMARSTGNLFFAGEHTTITHPATVHGAYLSGLRAASEVIDTMLGPIEIPTPLVIPKDTPTHTSSSFSSIKRKMSSSGAASQSPRASKQARIEAHENAVWQHIYTELGDRPWQPQKLAGNAYLLFSKANFEAARKRCEEGRRPGKGKPGPNEVRVMTSKMWKEASAEVKQPFEDEANEQKSIYAQRIRNWEEQIKEWDKRALEVRAAWEEVHPLVLNDIVEDPYDRRGKRVSTYAESDGSDIELGD